MIFLFAGTVLCPRTQVGTKNFWSWCSWKIRQIEKCSLKLAQSDCLKFKSFIWRLDRSPHLFQGLSIAASAWKASHTNGSMTGPFVSFVKSSEPTASFVRRRWSSPPRWPEIKPPQLMAVPQDKLSGPYTSECMPEDTSISPTTSNNLQNTFKPLTNGYCTVSKKEKNSVGFDR